MKIVKMLFLVLIMAMTSTGQTETLHNSMKALGKLFKQLNKNIDDPKMNAESAVSAQKMVDLFSEAAKAVPETISKMPADKKEAAKAVFLKLINKQIEGATQLKQALAANDNVAAKAAIVELKKTQKEGHDKYREEDK